MPRAGLRELADVQLVQQLRAPVVDPLVAGASLRDALSAWKPSIWKANASISASSTGIRKRSEIPATVATCCHCGLVEDVDVIHPLDPVQVANVDAVHAWTLSNRRKPGRPRGSGRCRTPVAATVDCVRSHTRRTLR